MSRHTLTYNGIDLSTFGAYVSGEGAFVKPAPEFEQVSVPGRSGDVLLYNGKYSNVDITYKMGIISNFNANYNALISCLLSAPGYHRLVDSSQPGGYRMAAVTAGISPEMTRLNRRGQFEVTFNCKPQFYLNEGDQDYYILKNGSSYIDGTRPRIANPTAFPARPMIKVKGYGDVVLSIYNSATSTNIPHVITISEYSGSASSFLYIDMETGNVESEIYENMNAYVENLTTRAINANESVGWQQTTIIPSTLTDVKVQPRWWRL